MSEQNVMVVRTMWEAFLRNDFEAALSAFEPDVEWDGTNLPDGKVSRGLDAVVEHLGGDQVIAFIRERGRTTAGLEVNERHAELYTARDGKIGYRKGFSHPDEALSAARLR
jgi:ketosteroid isomerase-like protein